MTLGGGVELPFLAPVMWVINGDAKLKAIGGAQYYGGWACKAEDLDDAVQHWAVNIPPNFALAEITTSDNTTFNAYTARSVIVAPIAVRQFWIDADGRRSAGYVDGGRHAVQAICMMAARLGHKDVVALEPCGPVMLSAKGYQARNLLGAFSAWNKHTAGLRRKVAPGVPAWCFYLSIGTFSKDRAQIMVGKTSQSPITPVTAYLPDDLSEEKLTRLFAGNEVANQMADLLDQAQDWLAAGKQESDRGASGGAGRGEPEYGPPPENWPPEEDIPF